MSLHPKLHIGLVKQQYIAKVFDSQSLSTPNQVTFLTWPRQNWSLQTHISPRIFYSLHPSCFPVNSVKSLKECQYCWVI